MFCMSCVCCWFTRDICKLYNSDLAHFFPLQALFGLNSLGWFHQISHSFVSLKEHKLRFNFKISQVDRYGTAKSFKT